MNAQIKRETFKTSRLLDFFSEKELTAQIGHAVSAWPLVALKELIDNALDACEDAAIAPVIDIAVDDKGITVTNNGPGLPADTVRGMLDFSVRISSREAYVAPDRGAQGNALKTLVAMPFVLDGECGRMSITAAGRHHEIVTKVDHIRQAPVISHNETSAHVKKGTSVTVHWPDSASSILHQASERILQISQAFVFLNPHLTLSARLFGEAHQWSAVDPNWCKWRPSNPTSPHWYEVEHLSRLIAAYIGHDKRRTVREFVSEFNGLSATAKQKAVLEYTNLARAPLTSLVQSDALDTGKITELLAAMKSHTKPVKPLTLGIIGRDNTKVRFESLGCEMETFKYEKRMGEISGLPWVIETAFGWYPEATGRALITGVNWSPGILNPFRELGRCGQSLDSILEQQRVGRATSPRYCCCTWLARGSPTATGANRLWCWRAEDGCGNDHRCPDQGHGRLGKTAQGRGARGVEGVSPA